MPKNNIRKRGIIMEVGKKEYAGKGQANFNTVGAGAGIASFFGLDAGNILGGVGRNGGNCHGDNGQDHVHYVTEKENDLGIALAIAKSEMYTSEQTKSDLEKLYVEIRREDEKIVGITNDLAKGMIDMSGEIGDLKGEAKCMQREIERNREEGYRNLAEAKDYTNVRVDALAKQTGCEIEKTYLWTQAQNYVPGTVKVDPNQICGPSPIAVGAPVVGRCCNLD